LFLVIFLYTLYLMVRHVARNLFLIDVVPTSGFDLGDLLDGRVNMNVLLLNVERFSLPQSGEKNVKRFDLAATSWEELWNAATETVHGSPASIILVEHLEIRMHDVSENRKKLRFIELLVETYRRNVLLVSASDPLADFRLEPAQENGGSTRRASDQRVRWQSLLTSFTRMVAEDKGDPDKFRARMSEGSSEVQRLLSRECYPDAALQAIGLQLNLEVNPVPASISARILESARSHYQGLWSTCSEEERRVLMHVALGGFVSPKNKKIVATLLERGLLDRRPQLRVMNSTFAKFIVSEHRRSEVSRSDERSTQTGWSIARMPVLLLLVSLVLFLYLTQQQVLSSTMAFISTASAFLPALFRLIGTITSDRGSNTREGE
jgi:hypothetical protein